MEKLQILKVSFLDMILLREVLSGIFLGDRMCVNCRNTLRSTPENSGMSTVFHWRSHIRRSLSIFVSPESIEESFRLTQEFRTLPFNHRAVEDKLEVKKILIDAMSKVVKKSEIERKEAS